MLVNKICFTPQYSGVAVKRNAVPPSLEACKYVPLRAEHFSSALSFCGYTTDLKESIKKLEEYEENHGEKIFPPGVREAAKEIKDSGNPYNLTLIDVHKQVYEDISLYIDNLDKLKSRHPEFSNVKSSGDVNFNKGSFLYRVKNNEIKNFNPDNETTLDLVRLLYAEGFSTNDLKEYTGGKSVYPTAVKLGISMLHPHYAHVLKLSDREYNERLVKTMADNKKDAKERRLQSGEPVFIPKRQMSKEEVNDVDNDLAEYFDEKPETIYEQTENQKRFYKEHPEVAKRFSLAVEKSWYMSESLQKVVKKYFSKNADKKIEIKDLDPFTILPEDVETLKGFWAKNRWAMDKFSANMRSVREEVGEADYLKYHTLRIVPNAAARDLMVYNPELDSEGCNIRIRPDGSYDDNETERFFALKETARIVHIMDQSIADSISDAYVYACRTLSSNIGKRNTEMCSEADNRELDRLKKDLDEKLGSLYKPAINRTTGKEALEAGGRDTGSLYKKAYLAMISQNRREYIDVLNNAFEQGYEEAMKKKSGKA